MIRFRICLLVATSAIFLVSCRSLEINSNPPGAMVIINGEPTSYVTPAEINPRDLQIGDYEIAVKMDGYQAVTPPQKTNVRLSKTEVIFSIFPWVLIKNLSGNRWKDYDTIQLFTLEKMTDGGEPQRLLVKQNDIPKQNETQASTGNPPATKIVQSEAPDKPVAERLNRKSVTNADVVMMLKAKLPESTIIMAIKQGTSEFDTTPSALVELRKHGATADILDAVMQPQPQSNQVKTRSIEQPNVAHGQKATELKTQNTTSPATTAKKATASGYVVGKTTKADVIAKLGEPNGRGVKADGAETLTYASSGFTAKAWNPFYFGNDNVRRKRTVFVFDKYGVLSEFSESEESDAI